jgi:hypothetical protein
MTERLLQYIWQFQYFNTKQLTIESGEELRIIHPGHYNTNQGPDFLEAKIKIGKTVLVGSIELHLLSSDWNKHRHQNDVNYKNVILHVVWQNDIKEDAHLPLLILQNRIARVLLHQYEEWMMQTPTIPCAASINNVKNLVWVAWKERLLIERLQRKSGYVLNALQLNRHHWEETFWQLLARSFGIKVNEDSFERIAKALPLSILAKHKNQLITLEALLLGQAGLLRNEFREEYPGLLAREYAFQQKKHKLQKETPIIVYFLRMRPASFPTIRLAQLAALVHQSGNLFTTIKEAASIKEVSKLLAVTASDYWNTHYKIDEPAVFKEKSIGANAINSIIINTVVPVLFSYGLYHNDMRYKNKALQWLEETVSEKNNITNTWQALNVCSKHAYDSQSLIELRTQYCQKKKCLDCAVGNAILKKLDKVV